MENLLDIFAKHEAESVFVAECVYAYLSEHCPEDKEFMEELIQFMAGEIK